MEQILDAPEASEQKLEYAGFWIRVGAAFIDGIILLVVQQVVILLFGGSYTHPSNAAQGINLLVGILYTSLMESSAKQATLGKMAVGIKVGDEFGNRISFANALGRYFSKILSAIILGIGFLMVGWDSKKQGLHDKIAGTFVFYGK
ncbi:MAG: RDD family protein [Chitinophagales bacterium]